MSSSRPTPPKAILHKIGSSTSNHRSKFHHRKVIHRRATERKDIHRPDTRLPDIPHTRLSSTALPLPRAILRPTLLNMLRLRLSIHKIHKALVAWKHGEEMGYDTALLLDGDVHFSEFMNCTVWSLSAFACLLDDRFEMTFVFHKLDFTAFNSHGEEMGYGTALLLYGDVHFSEFMNCTVWLLSAFRSIGCSLRDDICFAQAGLHSIQLDQICVSFSLSLLYHGEEMGYGIALLLYGDVHFSEFMNCTVWSLSAFLPIGCSLRDDICFAQVGLHSIQLDQICVSFSLSLLYHGEEMGYGTALLLYGDVHFSEFMNCTVWSLSAFACLLDARFEMTFALHIAGLHGIQLDQICVSFSLSLLYFGCSLAFRCLLDAHYEMTFALHKFGLHDIQLGQICVSFSLSLLYHGEEMGYGTALLLYGDVHFSEFMNCTVWLLYAFAAYWMLISR
ncbi:hypothetical protein ACSQ67_022762 [Phaseolus vulgaris]